MFRSMVHSGLYRIGGLVVARRGVRPQGQADELPALVATDELRELAFGEGSERILQLALALNVPGPGGPLTHFEHRMALDCALARIERALRRGELVAYGLQPVRLPAVQRPPVALRQERGPEPAAPPVREPKLEALPERRKPEPPFDVAIKVHVEECTQPVARAAVRVTLGDLSREAQTDDQGDVTFVLRDSAEEGLRDLKLDLGRRSAGFRYELAGDHANVARGANLEIRRTVSIENSLWVCRATPDQGGIVRGSPEIDLVEKQQDRPEDKGGYHWKWTLAHTRALEMNPPFRGVAMFGLTQGKEARVRIRSELEPLAPWRVVLEDGDGSFAVNGPELDFSPDADEPEADWRRKDWEASFARAANDATWKVKAKSSPRPEPIKADERRLVKRDWVAHLKVSGQKPDSDVQGRAGTGYIRITSSGDAPLAYLEPHVFEPLTLRVKLWTLRPPGLGPEDDPLLVNGVEIEKPKVLDHVRSVWDAAGIGFEVEEEVIVEDFSPPVPYADEPNPPPPPPARSGIFRTQDFARLMNAKYTPDRCNVYVMRELWQGFGYTLPRRQYKDSGQQTATLTSVAAGWERAYGLHPGKSGIGLSTDRDRDGDSRRRFGAHLHTAIALDLAHELGHFLTLGHSCFFRPSDKASPHAYEYSRRLMYGALFNDARTPEELGCGAVKPTAVVAGRAEQKEEKEQTLHGVLLSLTRKDDLYDLCEVQCARTAIRDGLWRDPAPPPPVQQQGQQPQVPRPEPRPAAQPPPPEPQEAKKPTKPQKRKPSKK